MKSLVVAAIICFLGVVNSQNPTLSQALQSNNLNTLLSALTSNNLINALESSAAITLFAPRDEAFQGVTLPEGNDLVELLKYHVIGASVQSSGITNNLMSDTLSTGTKIRFNIYDNESMYTAQGAVIDLEKVDIPIANGYIHVVKSVLPRPTQNVYEFVENSPGFSKLKGALGTAELQSALEGSGPFTVFAPSNTAEGSENLESDSKDLLDPILKYHVVSGTYFSAGLKDGMELTTLQGEKLKIVIDNNKVYIYSKTGGMVSTADVSVTNGVIHGVDKVLSIPVTGTASTHTCSMFTALAMAFAIVAVYRLG